MLASSQLDLCIGLDIHMEMVPVPPAPLPVPTPFPMPFVGMIEFSPGGLLLSVGIAGAMSAAFSTPPSGPVLVNGMQATKTGDEAQNKKTMPHMVIPPGIAWTPLPKPLKLKMKPGPPPAPDSPASPPGDAVMVTGSKTVYFEQSNACRLGTLAMSCSDPVRLPSSVLLAIPKGLPVLIGGPPTFDWATAAKAFFLRNKWTAGLLNQLVSLLPPGRFRGLLGWAACELTGHPVDVATGRLLTRAQDYELRGPIPLVFERFYSSAWAERDSTLGFGWSHSFDERIWLERGRVVYKMGDGREVEFHTYDLPGRQMRPGQEIFYGIDRLTLRCLGDGKWEIRDADGLTRDFSPLPGDPRVSRLTTIRNHLRQSVAFEYDPHRQLDGVRTTEGRWIRFEHRLGRLHRIAVPYPDGDAAGWYDQVTFEYSPAGDLVGTIDSQRTARTYRYENHLLVEETDRDGVSFYFEFDGRDGTASCVRTWGDDKKGQSRLYFREITYDRKNNRTLVENSLGHTTTYEMNAANTVVRILDPHGGATTRKYDEHLWKISETDPIGRVTRWEYDGRGNPTKHVLPNGAVFTMAYDGADQIVSSLDPVGIRREWSYDRRLRLTEYRSSHGDAVRYEYGALYIDRVMRSDGKLLAFERDAFGEVTKVTYPDGSADECWYDRLGRLVKVRGGGGQVLRFDYDLEGRVVEIVHPGGRVQTLGHSGEGDVVLDADVHGVEHFGYCSNHRMGWREKSGERIELRYDSEDDLVAMINEEGDEYRIVRDACGRVSEETTWEGRTQRYILDAAGRVTTRFLPDNQAVQLAYDALSNVAFVRYATGEEESYSYDLLGNMVTATNGGGTVHLERDARGRIVRERFHEDWVTSLRGVSGSLAEVTSSRGLSLRVSRGAMDDVQAVGAWERDARGAMAPRWHVGFERDMAGNERRRVMPGGVEAARIVGAADEVTLQTVSARTELISRTEYDWRTERLVGKRDLLSGRETAFVHDARGRLAEAQRSDGRTEVRAPGPTGTLFKRADRSDRTYGKGGVLLEAEGTSYAYDANGNVVEKRLPDGSSWKYRWNGPGFLASVTKPDASEISFEYDALGRRITKTADDTITRWLWNGDAPVHEWTGPAEESQNLTTWVFEPDTLIPLAKLTSAGSRYSIVSDYLGTPQEMFDAAGKLAWKAQLDVYGAAEVEHGAAADCPWRWPGQYEDAETGLYCNRFRYYDPDRGDYISQDPIRLEGLAPGSTFYSYTVDPLRWIDPLGLAPDIHHIATPKNPISEARGGPWTPRFAELFAIAGMSMEDAANKVSVPGHRGPHPENYHLKVFKRLATAVEGKEGPAAEKALKAELAAIAKGINKKGSKLNRQVTKKGEYAPCKK
jgi:RHS repeat-associated protein